MTANTDQGEGDTAAVEVPEVSEAAQLRERALAEARAAVQLHWQRAEQLKAEAIAAARELLKKEPLTARLLATLDQGGNGQSQNTTSVAVLDPLKAMDQLLGERQRSLDETLQRFMGKGAMAYGSEAAAREPGVS